MTQAVARPAAALRAAALLGGLAGAAALRLGAAAAEGSAAQPAAPLGAAALFAAVLLSLSLAAGWRPGLLALRGLAVGTGGGAALVGAALLQRLATPHLGWPAGLDGLWVWGLCAACVALAEEVLLRGVLFDAVAAARGEGAAVATAAVAFALLHVPLYGWTVLPVDLAAGVWLGGLRLAGRGVAAPAVAHALADLAAWWLR